MKKATRDKLRDEWFRSLTADQLAAKYHLGSPITVRTFWSKEKAAGRLPAHRRPAVGVIASPREFADRLLATRPALPEPFVPERVTVPVELAPAEIATPRPAEPPPVDPLLARLEAAHLCDPRRDFEERAGEALALVEAKHEALSPRGRMLRLARSLAFYDRAMRGFVILLLRKGTRK